MTAMQRGEALIVDDNFYNRDLSALALRHIGFTIAEAENGEDALNLLSQRTYDLLVLDLAMPVLDGVDVLRRIYKQATHARMRIIVMTANPHMATDEVEAMADYVMQKPIDINLFAALVRRLSSNKIIE